MKRYHVYLSTVRDFVVEAHSVDAAEVVALEEASMLWPGADWTVSHIEEEL